jgi:hypothetical protein
LSDEEFINSTLRLFLSVDIVGSTAFKQSAQSAEKDRQTGKPAELWFEPIVQFYREIEREFTASWDRYATTVAPQYGWPSGKAPEFWKSAGDELIYSKVVTDHREALACLYTWIDAINRYREGFRNKYPELDLKSAAWLAGFPVHNAEVFFRASVSDAASAKDDDDSIYSNLSLLKQYYSTEPTEQGRPIRDYIGPAMDTGFRLATLATPRKLVVAVDLALMLARAREAQGLEYPKMTEYELMEFHYDGRQQLKGVLGGRPYPIFWVDMGVDDRLNSVEDALARKERVNPTQVIEFCELFIERHPAFLFRPYIAGDTDPSFKAMPARHTERLVKLREYWKHERDKREGEKLSATMEPPGPEAPSDAVDQFLAQLGEKVATVSEHLAQLKAQSKKH